MNSTMMMTDSQKLRDACEAASMAFAKLNDHSFEDIKSKLDFCIGSYDHDNNPVGLIEFGSKALDDLKGAKERYPRKINKKLITDLEKVLA